jgi:RNA polymerase sigma-70 factor (ECF subfamily)
MNLVPTQDAATLSPSTNRKSFQKLVEQHRRELLAHCYRFTGSLHDAEDLVQETFLRAWRGIDKFEGRSSVRTWLYQIATNACLNAVERNTRARRVFPDEVANSTTRMPDGNPDLEIPWIEPMPDSMLTNIIDSSAGPGARYELRETVRLAFVAATQWLPPRQRAVLLLRDVLGWSAAETAEALKMSLASVTSALQRARGTIGQGLSPDKNSRSAGNHKTDEAVAQEYAEAWERSDLNGLIALLSRDASLVMPPWTQWYSGRSSIRSFLRWAFDWAWKSQKHGAFRLVATRANNQIAFGTYLRRRGETKFSAHALQVLTLRKGRISRIDLFVGDRTTEAVPGYRASPQLFRTFGLAADLNPT